MNLKMKFKESITNKLFIITAIVFAIFISSTLVIQSLFFEKFYINKKKSDLKTTIEKFKTNYNKPENSDKFAALIEEYEENSNIRIVILNSSGQLKFISKPPSNRMDPPRLRELSQFIFNWSQNPNNLEHIKTQNKTITLLTEKKSFLERNIISITPNNEKGEIIFALSSLQPVNEATSVIKEFYIYFCVGALFFIILLSSIYSNMITKPLVAINKTATKMAHLDFSEKCTVSSKDEIGSLAESLNFLSENLDNALTSLRDANAKLEEDIEKERNLERMRKDFVASVSHELKTPISLIDGYAVGLKDNIFEGEGKDYYLDIIIDESRKMSNLVSDMLDLSQLESGNFKLSREEFIITDLIRFTLKKYSTLANEKPVNIKMNLIENVKVNADWTRMEQVMVNFITNAFRHVNENGTITIDMIDRGNDISIEVENTGDNIPEDELEKIWDKFYKIDKSRSRKLGGTGIGLSIVKNILMLHNYPFGVYNTENGIRFYFMVPKNYI